RAPEEGHGGYPVSEAALRELSIAEDRHFWHATRNELIAERLARAGVESPARVLELGCGGGCVAAHLSRAGYRVVGVDGSVARLREAAARAPNARFLAHDLGLGVPAEAGADFDAAGLFDVVEHLDDPVSALAAAVASVRPGGLVVGTVPAEMALWSVVDQAAGHRLRYDVPGLGEMLRRVVGAEVVEVVPFNRAIYPVLWLQRRLAARDASAAAVQSLRVPAAPLNALFGRLLRAERRGRLPVASRWPGTSIWFALRRDRPDERKCPDLRDGL
ncbi:MAG TPA: class I SAM-dependent methyltransferase, partial [Anaeromyxobacteraceae bacterium]|nr:class I SAM-dependent methyltransferase [Anaeromyxobacteraceae bacterium]